MDAITNSWQQSFYSRSNLDFTESLNSHGVPSPEMSPSFRFYMILGIAQDMRVDFLPVTYQAALGALGAGATGDIQQSFVNSEFNLAFKRIWHSHVLLNEMIILSHAPLRSHPYIVGLEGISWEVAVDGDMRPVLVFEKSTIGDLYCFMGTDVGMGLSFMERWSLCTQIAMAVNVLHEARIVHGDIKPHNMLVFKSGSVGFIAKLTDFGYSRWLAPQEADSLVYIPRSVPWNAPEYHHRGFKFIPATRTDVFSFGVFTLWLLSYNVSCSKTDFMSDTAHLEPGSMVELAKTRVREMSDVEEKTKTILRQVFDLCLAAEPEHRPAINSILQLFQSEQSANPRYHNSIPLGSAASKIEARQQSTARFQVAPAMPQLFEVDFRVRRQMFRCLKTLAEESLGNDIWSVYQEACLQLAFCYRMGFGVERADATAEIFLVQSQMRQVLEDQLVALKSSVNQCYNPFAIFGNWHARGHVSTSTDAQYYREQKQLTSIQVVHEREILNWRTVLGTAHWIVIVKTGHYCSILENLGYLDKAEELARDTLTEVSRTLPDNHLAIKEIKYTLSKALYMQGKLAMAEKLVKEVVEMQNPSSDEIDHTILLHMNFMACIYATQGKRRKAAALMETLLRNFSQALGKYHIHTIIIMWNLCEIYRQQRRIKQATRLNENIIQTATEALGEDHEISVLARMSLTRLRWERRTWIGGYIGPREDDTLRLDYIENSQVLLGNNHPWTLEIMVSTVRNLVSKARFDEAIALQGQIVALSEKRPGPNHPHTIAHRNRLTHIKKVYWSYRFFERIGSLNMGGYVLTPGFREREGLERICWPLYRKKDMSKFIKKPFSVDLSVGSDQS